MKILSDEDLERIIKEKIEKVGLYDSRRKQAFIFELSSKYGEIFDREQASIVYDKVFEERLNNEG